MEKKTIDTLRVMICGELDDIAKKGSLSHETLDILKDLLESAKDLEKIEEAQMKKEEMYMDMGQSQRSMGRYFIDGQYGNGGSYGYGGQSMGYGQSMDGGNSYRRAMYDNGNSYMYYDPRYEMSMAPRRGGYSMASKSEMVSELKKMMMDTSDEKVRTTISNAITQLEK